VTELFADVAPDGRGGTIGIAARRVLMASFALISLAALIGFFGQRSTTSAAVTPSVRMTLDAPETVRGGIYFQFEVDPTNVGERSFTLELDDEDRLLARIPRTLRVLP